MSEREECVYRSKLAEQAERYEDMVEWMQKVAEMDQEMSVEERNLLSVAYKNVIGTKRASWRIITGIEQKEVDKKNESGKQLSYIVDYRKKIETELKQTCNKVLEVLKAILAKQDNIITGESKVFYYKMKGDYYRYMAEITTEEQRTEAAQDAMLAYKKSTEISEEELPMTHPIRLGLALNFSVFYYEILNSPEEACKTAKKSFDGAIRELDKLPEENYKDSTLIMQLLRDNLTLWTSENTNENEIEGEQQDDQNDDAEQDD